MNGPGPSSGDPPDLGAARPGPRGPLSPRWDPTVGSRLAPRRTPSPSGPGVEAQGAPPPPSIDTPLLVIRYDFRWGGGGGVVFINCHIEIAESGFVEAWMN